MQSINASSNACIAATASSNACMTATILPNVCLVQCPAQYVSFPFTSKETSTANYDGGTPSVVNVIVRAFSSCKSRDGNFHASHFRQDRRFIEIQDAYERIAIRIDWLVCAEFGNDSSKIRDCQCGECMDGSLELMFKGGFSKCNFVEQSIGWFIECFRIISPIMEI